MKSNEKRKMIFLTDHEKQLKLIEYNLVNYH